MSRRPDPRDAPPSDDLGESGLPLCREPWERYYILRRGILPCCYGNPVAARMSDWKQAWNSRRMRKIRRDLASGRLGRYCLESRGCPIVLRYLAQEAEAGRSHGRPAILGILNRLALRIPGRIYAWWRTPKALRRFRGKSFPSS